MQPYADKEAFKIIREKYFQKEEEKLFVRIQVLSDLLAQKRDKLRRYQQSNRNLDLPEPLRQVIMKNLAAAQNVKRPPPLAAKDSKPKAEEEEKPVEKPAEEAEVQPEVVEE